MKCITKKYFTSIKKNLGLFWFGIFSPKNKVCELFVVKITYFDQKKKKKETTWLIWIQLLLVDKNTQRS